MGKHGAANATRIDTALVLRKQRLRDDIAICPRRQQSSQEDDGIAELEHSPIGRTHAFPRRRGRPVFFRASFFLRDVAPAGDQRISD